MGKRRLLEERREGVGRIGGIVVLCVLAAAAIALAITFGPGMWSFFLDIDAVRAWIAGQGALAPFAMAAVVVAQIVIAVLPGEPIELAAGYLFGFWGGTALCLAGSLAGTLGVTGLVRAFGMRVVRLFFTREQIEGVPWLRDSSRLEAVMFAVFLIPGTPKDVLTYAAALTECPWWRIAAITTIGRVPSIVSSTLAAGFAADGNWALAAVTAGVMVALAVVGAAVYAALQRKARSEG